MFKWLKKLFRVRDDTPVQVVAPTRHDRAIEEMLRRERTRLRDMHLYGEMRQQQNNINQLAAGQAIQYAGAGIGQAFDQQQQQAAQQQAAYHQAQQPWQYQGLFHQQTYQTLMFELQANGMPEPDLKDKDLLGVEMAKIKPMTEKLHALFNTSNEPDKYYRMYDTLIHMDKNDTVIYAGSWGFDLALQEYVVKTNWSNYELPLSVFTKLPQTMDECIEVMEKSLWSSRKSPITKKDIA